MSRLMVTKIRERLGMSQREFAEKLGVQVSTVWRWETGRAEPRAEMRAMIVGLETRKQVEPVTVDEPVVDEPTVIEPVAVNDHFKAREVTSYGRDVEIALLGAAAQVTASWIASHKFTPEAADVESFILKTTRALRQE